MQGYSPTRFQEQEARRKQRQQRFNEGCAALFQLILNDDDSEPTKAEIKDLVAQLNQLLKNISAEFEKLRS